MFWCHLNACMSKIAIGCLRKNFTRCILFTFRTYLICSSLTPEFTRYRFPSMTVSQFSKQLGDVFSNIRYLQRKNQKGWNFNDIFLITFWSNLFVHPLPLCCSCYNLTSTFVVGVADSFFPNMGRRKFVTEVGEVCCIARKQLRRQSKSKYFFPK